MVAEELARHIDPGLPGKTLIFAATDAHADLVVKVLKTAFADAYGSIDNAAIEKVTGSIDKPGQMIRRFRNDAVSEDGGDGGPADHRRGRPRHHQPGVPCAG
ncbi:hypothetical protein [Dankookia sp. P2]|uniref:hypothetical protein n=1 Tax=Dankookia sp. P2 TaxID=3423955 RepID=UPI003D67195B